MPKPAFLGSPEEIRRLLLGGMSGRQQLKMAVAFVTSEWMRVLADFRGSGRLICWLTSGATDPAAVKMLMRRPGFRVKHLHAMHAKVYLSGGPKEFAIVGSANLSSPALAGSDRAGNTEAAVVVTAPKEVARIDAWFESLWNAAREVTPADLKRAKKAWKISKEAQKNQAENKGTRASEVPAMPPSWIPSNDLEVLAAKVRRLDLRAQVPDLSHLRPQSLSKQDVEDVVDHLTSWARRRGKFAPVQSVDIRTVRKAFRVAFDESLSVEERLSRLEGSHKLPGLGLPSWTMILYYWSPKNYPPYNARTPVFIRLFGLGTTQVVLTPHGYAAWLELCGELAVQLRLPSIGHVDRLVWLATKGEDEE